MSLLKLISGSLLAASLVCLPLIAQAGSGGHGYHAGVFMGATQTHGKTHATVGVDIEKRMTDTLGLGLIIDSFVKAPGQAIFALGFFYHPTEHLKLILAPGSEFSHGTSQSVLRLGLGYDWHFSNGLSVGPSVSNDILRSDSAQVYGISIGYGF